MKDMKSQQLIAKMEDLLTLVYENYYIRMIRSPCVKVCKLDKKRKMCIACKRTIEEIMQWSVLSDNDKSKILIDLKIRKII